MKLRTIHVEGFGLLREKTLQLDGPLTVLYGRNEAGKSTLMGFIRAVLFGFPARAGGAGSLEPLMGAAHGGYLTLETDEGERIRVERRDGAPASAGRARAPGGGHVRVTLASGAQGGAELLQPLLGGITGELFRSLFAFSLSELQEVRTLQSDALSGYLYSAGLGARGDTIMAAERKLALEMEQLFRPRGRNQALNQTLQKLEEQELDLRRSKELAGRYNDYIAELARLDEQIQAADTSVREQRNSVAWLEAAEQARNHWLRGKEIRILLTNLPKFKKFPEDAITRFNDLTKDKDQLLSERNKQQLALEKLQSHLELLLIDPTVLLHQTELESLYDQLTAYRVNQTTDHDLKIEIDQQTLQLERLLRQIAAHWNENTLREYAVTVVDREQVRLWDAKLNKLQQERFKSVAELERNSFQTEEAKEKAKKLESKLSYKKRQVYDDLTLEAQYEMDALLAIVSQLRKQLQQKQQLQLELRHLEQRELDYSKQAPNGQALETMSNRTPFVLNALRWFCSFANVLLPLYFIVNGQQIAAWLSFFILLAVSLGIWFYSPKPEKVNRAMRFLPAEDLKTNTFQSEKKQLEKQLAVIEMSLSQRLLHLKGITQAASASLNPESQPSILNGSLNPMIVNPMNDQQAEESLDLLQQAAEAWRENKRELAHDELMWQDAADAYEKQQKLKKLAGDQLAELEENLVEAIEAWQAWLTGHELARELSPTGALELFQIIESSQLQLQLKQRNEVKREAVQLIIADFERQTKSLLVTASIEEIPAALKKWKESAERTTQSLQTKHLLEQQLQQTKSDLMLSVDALDRISQRINELWAAAEAGDESQFRLHLRQYMERITYEEELQRLEAALDIFIGSTRKDQLEKLLLELTPQELKQKIKEDSSILQQVELQTDQLKENRGKLRNELEKLEQGAEHSERLQLLEERAAVLTEQAGQWAKTAICSALFRKARELYERERQPGVLLLATEYFQKITADEYVRVLVPFGEKRIVVEHSSGRMMDSSLLSRGTAEQLYLSMRFALAEEYARKASLPLILDDILVNFDKERMEQTIALLAEISTKHQVIFFTCHRHVADAFAAQFSDHQQVHL